MVVKEVCPECGSDRYKKNGDTRHGKQNHHYKACGHQFISAFPLPGPTNVVVQRPEAEADEMWSFVGEKANKQWSWFTMDAKTHQIMAFHVADRSRASRAQLWANVPEVYRQQAVFHTDLYNAFLLWYATPPPARVDPIVKTTFSEK